MTEAVPNPPEDRWQALWQAGVDDDSWNDKYHSVIAQSGRLLLSQYSELLPLLLNQYGDALTQGSWEERRILLAILAACLETMPQTIQNLCNELGLNLEQLLIQGTKDYGSHNSRRFALTGLSYLRYVTSEIVPVLITALQENVDIVQKNALEAARRFQSIDEGVIEELGQYLTGESIQTAYGVSQMLTSLGVMAAGEDSTLRQQIIGLLVEALSDEGCRREYDRDKRLEDAFYNALLQVAGLPA